MKLPPWPSGVAVRVLILALALIPLLVIVICSIPAEVLYPILPKGARAAVRERRSKIIEWAINILIGSRPE